MGLFNPIIFSHTFSLGDKNYTFENFQSKSGLNDLKPITPKELVDFCAAAWDDVDGISFSDYSCFKFDGEDSECWEVEFTYRKEDDTWERRVYKKVSNSGQFMLEEFEVLYKKYPAQEFWSKKEQYLHDCSAAWDTVHGDKAKYMAEKEAEWDANAAEKRQ